MATGIHLRGIVIAGALAALALALGFVTLMMNQTASQAAPHTVLPLKLRHHKPAASKAVAHPKTVAHSKTVARSKTVAHPKTVVRAKHVTHKKPKRVDANFSAAVKAGLPRSVARALAARRVAVVEVTSKTDSVAELSAGEAKAGAALAGASYVAVNVDRDGGDVEVLTRLLGQLPVAPATLIYIRPATLVATLSGFNDRTVVQQAAASAPSAAATAPAR